MPESQSLAKAYTLGMARHGYGRALFHPVPIEAMKAPCVGYFDDRGKWHLITSLVGQPEDPQWKKSDYTYLQQKPKRQPVATHRWGPKHSSDVYDVALGFSAATPDLSAAGIPAQFSIDTKYRTASNVGAILITAPRVVHEDFSDGYDQPYKKWIEQNFDTLHSNGEKELKRYGLWVITETYSTAACLIQTWTGKTREIKLDLKADAMMAGKLGPSFGWSRDQNCDALSLHVNEDSESRVVAFCSGLRYMFRRWKGVKYEPHVRHVLYERQHYYSSEMENHEASPDIISTKNGTKYEVNLSSIMDEEDSDSDGEHGPVPESAQGGSSKGLNPPSSSLPSPYNIECDNCGHQNLITSYHCRSCPDFDLCSNCISLGCTNNPCHELVRVRQVSRSPSPRPENARAGQSERRPIDCDRCNERDLVKFYRCRTCRPRFDLCETCHIDEHKGCDVDPRHGFVKTQIVGGRERAI